VVQTKLARDMTLESEMASNSASSFRVELSDVDNLHGLAPASSVTPTARGNVARIAPANGAATAHSSAASAAQVASLVSGPLSAVTPFAALAARHGRPLKVAILSDFTRIPYANGAAFQTRFLYQELRRCGHQVTLIGPKDPEAKPGDVPEGTIELPSLPLKTYPGVHFPLPLAAWVYDPDNWDFDIVFAQTTSMLLEFGVWLRKMKGIPLLCVNTTHLVAAYDVLLPEALSKIEVVRAGIELALKRPFERLFSDIYNNSDGLVVLSEGLRTYWRERGVTAPIHVIPRAVQPEVFDKPLGPDPFTSFLATHRNGSDAKVRGSRLLCAGRHTREKSQDRVIRIFAEHVASADPDVTLTVLGAGPDTEYYKRVAQESGVGDRVYFPGEVPFMKMADFYAYADVFVHASLSETYGNVMGEALWCGTPTVAFADGMGVTAQITDGVNGVLLAPGSGRGGEADADSAFGRAVVSLLHDAQQRGRLGKAAAKRARERCSPAAVQQRMVDAFESAQDHLAMSGVRPAVNRPRAMQWYTTFKHFRPWTTISAGLYIFGHLRPAPADGATKGVGRLQPQIGS
jgi:1,2-diacylglycerol 3-alpha-glucosyltransferase